MAPELDPKDPKNREPRYVPPAGIDYEKIKTQSRELLTRRLNFDADHWNLPLLDQHWYRQRTAIMSRETGLANSQKEFITTAIQDRTRLDGRELDEYRDLKIIFANYGEVMVQLGDTWVTVCISAEVTEPLDDKPFEGLFSINLELNEMASAAFQSGRAGDYEAKIVEVLDQVYRRSGALDTESLCIVSGKSCWKINANIHVLCHEGSLVDASAIALVTALQHFRRRDSEVRDGEPIIFGLDERDPVPLNITYKPLVTSYCCFDNNRFLVLDPTRQEEMAAEGEFAVALDTAGVPSLIKTLSGPELHPEAAVDQAQESLDRIISLTEEIEKALQKDLASRSQGKLAAEARSNNNRPVDAPSTQ